MLDTDPRRKRRTRELRKNERKLRAVADGVWHLEGRIRTSEPSPMDARHVRKIAMDLDVLAEDLARLIRNREAGR